MKQKLEEGKALDYRNGAGGQREEYQSMRHVQTIHRVAEVALLLIKVLGGNWSAIFSLALGMMELYVAWRGRETGVVPAV